MAYATPAQLIARYDQRLLGDLVQDRGAQVGQAGLLNNDPALSAALDDASGAIDAALLTGGRYTPTQLAGLSGNSANHLVRMTCDIAILYLVNRRVYAKLNQTLESIMERAEKFLKQLKTGEDVFDIPEVIDAGNPSVSGPTTMQLENLHSVRRQTLRYYPHTILPNNR